MYCSKCGAPNEDQAVICIQCGTSLSLLPPFPKTSVLAITSLVFGIMSLVCAPLAAIPAFIFGITAFVSISKNPREKKASSLRLQALFVHSLEF